MGRLKKACAIIYLLAFAVVLASFASSLAGPFSRDAAELLDLPAFQAFLAACMAICALQALYVLGRVVFDKPEPRCIHPQGVTDLEVTTSALEAVARTAARDEDVLVDRVLVRIRGRAHDALYVTIEAIALDDTALDVRAAAMRSRVEQAMRDMLGTSCASVRVRFLPARTTVVTKEDEL